MSDTRPLGRHSLITSRQYEFDSSADSSLSYSMSVEICYSVDERSQQEHLWCFFSSHVANASRSHMAEIPRLATGCSSSDYESWATRDILVGSYPHPRREEHSLVPMAMTSLSNNSSSTNVAALLKFIGDDLLGGASDLDATTKLLALGVIDSLTMVSVITFIREHFGVEVPNDAVTANNFQTVEAIAAMVDRLVHCEEVRQ